MNSDLSREIIKAAPSLPSFSVSEKLALYGSAGLSGMELLVLLVGKESSRRLWSVTSARLRRYLTPRFVNCVNSFRGARPRP
jgi:hypothetical protein